VIEGDRLPTLDTPRLRLRWLTPEDGAALYDVFSDPEVARYLSRPPWTDPAGAAKLVEDVHESFERRELFQWGVARREDDRVIGTCTLAHVSVPHFRAEIGYALARESWGRGLGREAIDRVIAFAFDELRLHRIEADVDPRNERSIRLLEGAGFVREGHLRERWHVGGEICDGLFFGLLRREWEARRQPVKA
jgi:RimJ/RimL family protein N-acetyltransferase